MRSRSLALLLLAALAVAGGGCATTLDGPRSHRSHAQLSVSVGAYCDDVAPYGTWLDLDPYGWVWCPLDVSTSWRPYTIGM